MRFYIKKAWRNLLFLSEKIALVVVSLPCRCRICQETYKEITSENIQNVSNPFTLNCKVSLQMHEVVKIALCSLSAVYMFWHALCQ